MLPCTAHDGTDTYTINSHYNMMTAAIVQVQVSSRALANASGTFKQLEHQAIQPC